MHIAYHETHWAFRVFCNRRSIIELKSKLKMNFQLYFLLKLRKIPLKFQNRTNEMKKILMHDMF